MTTSGLMSLFSSATCVDVLSARATGNVFRRMNLPHLPQERQTNFALQHRTRTGIVRG
jgi:hypothetical protein